MSSFEFVFSLFGLLLGFTLVEVLNGLVRTTKLRRNRLDRDRANIKIGWLTPLLAIFVMMDVSSYWENVWTLREGIPVGHDTIFGGLLISGLYFYAASMVFPDEPRSWPDLDDWFWQHRRQVLGPLLAVSVCWTALTRTLDPPRSLLNFSLLTGLYLGLMLIAFVDRRRLVVAAALMGEILVYLASAANAFGRHVS